MDSWCWYWILRAVYPLNISRLHEHMGGNVSIPSLTNHECCGLCGVSTARMCSNIYEEVYMSSGSASLHVLCNILTLKYKSDFSLCLSGPVHGALKQKPSEVISVTRYFGSQRRSFLKEESLCNFFLKIVFCRILHAHLQLATGDAIHPTALSEPPCHTCALHV